MKHERNLSQICKAYCMVCGNTTTTTAYDGKMKPFVPGIDWGSGPNDMDDLLKMHHGVVFTILLN